MPRKKKGSILAVRCLKSRDAVTIVRDVLRLCEDDVDFAHDVRASGEVEADAVSACAELAPPFPRGILTDRVKPFRMKDPGFLNPGFHPYV